jgi:hypothetical protein
MHHAWLFSDPPPRAPHTDRREATGEVFMHYNSRDCIELREMPAQRYANRAGRDIRSIREETLDLMQSYDWPGNIRELQNVIEMSLV